MSSEDPAPLRFSNEPKLRSQMRKRRWTEQEIREALATTPLSCNGHKGPAFRYVHSRTGKSVVVDATTGEIFHVGGEGFRYDA